MMKFSALPIVSPSQSAGMAPSFEQAVAVYHPRPLRAQSISTLQVNVGKSVTKHAAIAMLMPVPNGPKV